MSWALWITGLPGSGKSVLARETRRALRARGQHVTWLELDALRKVLTPEPTYGDPEREAVYRALVYMATELTAAGVPVIVDATAHRRAWRELARGSVAHFAEVQLTCPVELCREREHARSSGNASRHVYAHAGRAGASVPGVDVDYEPAQAPELTIDTAQEPTDVSVTRIVGLAERLSAASGAAPRPASVPEAWVVWITGLPGSGKTTIAAAVATALSARRDPVRVLDLSRLRRLIVADGPASPWQSDVAHRTLACTAKLLAEAGIPVVVDATAPRRIWREIARGLIGRFAEVQLVCPREVCLARERAARWSLDQTPWPDHSPASLSADPDIVLDYEASLQPELVVYTDVQTPSTAVDEVLVLTRSLEHR